MHLAVRTIDFDYPLPEELIADRPLPDRSASRLMVIHRDTGMIEHRHFCDLPEYVREGDHFIPVSYTHLLQIAGRQFTSRLMVGTGKFPSNESMKKALEASGAQIVTVALRRRCV